MIHPSAVVSSDADIDDNVRIDAYAVVEANVAIGSGSWLGSHCVIREHTHLGCDNRVHEFAVLGGEPQSNRFRGEITRLEIGHRNSIREMVSISRGTAASTVTKIGDDNIIMAYSHIAHDCVVGNNCVFANGSSFAGHVEIDDYASIGGFTLVHQNCRIGAHCMTGINTVLRQDVAPYMTVNGNPARTIAVNERGISRRGFSANCISVLKKVHKLYFRQHMTLDETVGKLGSETEGDEHLQHLIEFLRSSQRGVVR